MWWGRSLEIYQSQVSEAKARLLATSCAIKIPPIVLGKLLHGEVPTIVVDSYYLDVGIEYGIDRMLAAECTRNSDCPPINKHVRPPQIRLDYVCMYMGDNIVWREYMDSEVHICVCSCEL